MELDGIGNTSAACVGEATTSIQVFADKHVHNYLAREITRVGDEANRHGTAINRSKYMSMGLAFAGFVLGLAAFNPVLAFAGATGGMLSMAPGQSYAVQNYKDSSGRLTALFNRLISQDKGEITEDSLPLWEKYGSNLTKELHYTGLSGGQAKFDSTVEKYAAQVNKKEESKNDEY